MFTIAQSPPRSVGSQLPKYLIGVICGSTVPRFVSPGMRGLPMAVVPAGSTFSRYALYRKVPDIGVPTLLSPFMTISPDTANLFGLVSSKRAPAGFVSGGVPSPELSSAIDEKKMLGVEAVTCYGLEELFPCNICNRAP